MNARLQPFKQLPCAALNQTPLARKRRDSRGRVWDLECTSALPKLKSAPSILLAFSISATKRKLKATPPFMPPQKWNFDRGLARSQIAVLQVSGFSHFQRHQSTRAMEFMTRILRIHKISYSNRAAPLCIIGRKSRIHVSMRKFRMP